MDKLEASTSIEIEKIKAKAAIAVAILSNAKSEFMSADLSSDFKEALMDTIKKAQATID